MYRFGKSAFIAAMALTLPISANAHALWLNLTDWNPAIKANGKAQTRMYVGWGHKYPVDGLTNRDTFESLTLITPQGIPETFEIEAEGISTTKFTPNRPGRYALSVVRHPSINTTYIENGMEKKAKLPKTKFADVVSSIYSQQFATSYFYVGDKVAATKFKPVGNTLELVPLTDPYAAGTNLVGGTFAVQLLLEGKPVPYTQVTATYAGYSAGDDMAARALTNADGIAEIRISHWGPWLFKARAERPASGDIAKVANTEVYYTSLTFEI